MSVRQGEDGEEVLYTEDPFVAPNSSVYSKTGYTTLRESTGGFSVGSTPVSLVWEDISYSVRKKGSLIKSVLRRTPVEESHSLILDRVSGAVLPGQLLAIIGASGAGKTTLLDVLAGRTKSGKLTGQLLVNGKPRDKYYKRISGYVTQDDCLMERLTVREVFMFYANLRLPANISHAQRVHRVEQVIDELGLEKIRDSKIGGQFLRGISGGERKRVSIGCELITDPSILFLDEPTTGLDSYNSLAVMDRLGALAKKGRTVVCTIHQPRSTIFSNFDQLMIMSQGRVAYQGPARDAVAYFSGLHFHIKPFINPADFLLDVVIENDEKRKRIKAKEIKDRETSPLLTDESSDEEKGTRSESYGLASPAYYIDFTKNSSKNKKEEISSSSSRSSRSSSDSESNDENENENGNDNMDNKNNDDSNKKGKNKITKEKKKKSNNKKDTENATETPSDAANYVVDFAAEYEKSKYFKRIQKIIEEEKEKGKKTPLLNLTEYAANWFRQIFYLSIRHFVNLIRNPMTTYVLLIQTLFMSLLVGSIYFHIEDDQRSIQDRVGALFFIVTNQAFSQTASLSLFLQERDNFNRERAAGVYSTSAYFFSKNVVESPWVIVFPLIFSSVSYWMCGFQADIEKFGIFCLTVITFAATASSLFLVIGSISPSQIVATILAPITTVLLLLFGGFYINNDNIPVYYRWIHEISFFRYGYEILMKNEFTGLTFSCSNPPRCIATGEEELEIMAMENVNIWINMAILAGMIIGYRILAYIAIRYLYKEKR